MRAISLPHQLAGPAFSLWLAEVQDPVTEFMRGDRRRLAPLLGADSAALNETRSGHFRDWLRASSLHETRRHAAFVEAARNVLTSLRLGGVPLLVSRGPALAATVYAPGRRHCHDLDLLVPSRFVQDAVAVLRSAGLMLSGDADGSIVLVHPSGLPVKLHSRLFWSPAFNIDIMTWLGRSSEVEAYGTRIAVPGPEDLLLHIVVHASTQASGQNLLWVSDFARVTQAFVVDWDRVGEQLLAYPRLAFPLAWNLPWLARVTNVDIPLRVLDRIHATAIAQPAHVRRPSTLALARSLGGIGSLAKRSAGWTDIGELVITVLRSPKALGELGLRGRLQTIPAFYWHLVVSACRHLATRLGRRRR